MEECDCVNINVCDHGKLPDHLTGKHLLWPPPGEGEKAPAKAAELPGKSE